MKQLNAFYIETLKLICLQELMLKYCHAFFPTNYQFKSGDDVKSNDSMHSFLFNIFIYSFELNTTNAKKQAQMCFGYFGMLFVNFCKYSFVCNINRLMLALLRKRA